MKEVCSLELCKKLCDIGIKQNTFFFWRESGFTREQWVIEVSPDEYALQQWIKDGRAFPAFTIGELMEMLPAFIDIKTNMPFNYFWLLIQKRHAKNIQYIVIYECDSVPGEEFNNPLFRVPSPVKAYDENLANALAKTLILLIESNIIEINNEKKFSIKKD